MISLKGVDGVSYAKVKNAQCLKADGSGQAGENGRPGKPGQNGGYFIGRAMNSNGVINEIDKLTIDVSGGDGGSGEDGGDGAKGMDGEDGNIEEVKGRDTQFCVKRKKYTFKDKDKAGKVETVFKAFLTFNGQMLETYRSSGKPPAKGGDAGCGGVGGLGGNAGKVSLINLKGDSISVQNCTGRCGVNGSAGEPGMGGKYGTVYEGVYLNEIVAPFANLRREAR